jgi:hypothetical protein
MLEGNKTILANIKAAAGFGPTSRSSSFTPPRRLSRTAPELPTRIRGPTA